MIWENRKRRGWHRWYAWYPVCFDAITTGSAGCTAAGIGPAVITGPGSGSGPTD